jgi:hypothetical protein
VSEAPTPTPDPREEYGRRFDRYRALAARRARTASTLSNARLAVFVTGVVMAWFVFGAPRIEPHWLWLPIGAFVALVILHDRVLRARSRAERAAAYYEAGLERLAYRFGPGGQGERLRDSHHLYAEDLDLFGRDSLFTLLCRARTRRGEDTLAGWLLQGAPREEIRARQEAVAELRGLLDLRERLALAGEELAPRLHADELVAWGATAPAAGPRGARVAAAGLAGLSASALSAWILGMASLLPLLGILLVQSVFAWRFRGRVRACTRDVERAGRDLDLLSGLLACLEDGRFRSPRLVALLGAVETAGVPPSRRISRLRFLRDLLDARRNQFVAFFGWLFLFSTQVVLAIEAWRAKCGPALERWVAAVAELEALSSLATYAFEHPADPFPEILESGPRFEAMGIGHPLIPEDRCVRNDLALSPQLRVLVVSGSNMSGKSTLLRSVGTNALLALAGAPVRARSLRISPLALGASIRIQDSLREGSSRFYAEITRIERIVKRSEGALPVLFLLDEILHGTNSHDRKIGAEAVVRSLVERGAVGLVTTHDLALTQVADALAPRAANVHFQDHLEDGRMTFDYRMQPGVVTKSNALALMRAVGLEV